MEIAFVFVAFGLLFFVSREKEKARKFTKDRAEKVRKVIEDIKKEAQVLRGENLSNAKPADIFVQSVQKKYDIKQQIACVSKELDGCKKRPIEADMLRLHIEALEAALEMQDNALFYVKECVSQTMSKNQ